MKVYTPIVCLLLLFGMQVNAQDSLLKQLDSLSGQKFNKVQATFKATRVINGQSIAGAGKGVLQFVVSHRFGRVNEGVGTFFGIDDANTLLNLEYGISDNLQVAIQRSSFNKMLDGYLKYRFLHQTIDDKLPLSAALFLETSANTTQYSDDVPVRPDGVYRWTYVAQLLLARKFNEHLSVQLSPTFLHRNLVPLTADFNNTYALGAGLRYKVTKRTSVNFEYFYRFNPDETATFNPIAIGVDIETGGHVFQLHLTNARQMNERGFITETSGDFFKGDIHFGFNISRVFNLGKKD